MKPEVWPKVKDRIKKICLSLIIIQGKAKKYIYKHENLQKCKDLQSKSSIIEVSLTLKHKFEHYFWVTLADSCAVS